MEQYLSFVYPYKSAVSSSFLWLYASEKVILFLRQKNSVSFFALSKVLTAKKYKWSCPTLRHSNFYNFHTCFKKQLEITLSIHLHDCQRCLFQEFSSAAPSLWQFLFLWIHKQSLRYSSVQKITETVRKSHLIQPDVCRVCSWGRKVSYYPGKN